MRIFDVERERRYRDQNKICSGELEIPWIDWLELLEDVRQNTPGLLCHESGEPRELILAGLAVYPKRGEK